MKLIQNGSSSFPSSFGSSAGRVKPLLICCLSLVSLNASVNVYATPASTSAISDQKELLKTIQYQFDVTNTTNRLIEEAGLVVNLPKTDVSIEFAVQDINTIDRPFKTRSDQYGNRQLYVWFPSIKPYETKQLTIKATLQIREKFNQLDKNEFGKWLEDGDLLKHQQTSIQKTLRELGLQNSDAQTDVLNKVYQWIVNNIKPVGFNKDSLGAEYALAMQQADCTDTVYLFSALMRASGIPTRMLGGFIVETNKKLTVRDYHNWAEVLINDRWHVIDPFLKHFKPNKKNYLPLVELSANSDKSKQTGTALFKALNPVLKIQMN